MSYYNQQQPAIGVPPPQGYPKDYPPVGYPPEGYPQGYPPQAQGYPPPYAQAPPKQEPGFLEGCLAALCCCCLFEACF